MAGRTLPFYRSRLTPAAFTVTGAYLTYALSPLGPPEWRDTPSLRWLHTLLAWPLLSTLFLIYTVFAVMGVVGARASVVAPALGLVLYGWELVALIVTARTDRPTNPLAIAAVFLACVLHYAAARLAIIQAARSDR